MVCCYGFYSNVSRRTSSKRKVCDIPKSWMKACDQAGIPGDARSHDLRRSGVRNMVRAGVPETVALAISGHKTWTVLDRYNITSDDDLKEAAQPMGGGLFELRPRGREGIGRAFYCFAIGRRIVILHAFKKKTRETPGQALRVARRRMKEIQNG